MKVVMVGGPFSGANSWEIEQNVRRAEELGLEVATLGASPISAHSMGRFWAGTLTYEFWIEATKELLARSDALIVTPDWEKSSGTRGEIEEAHRLGKPVFYSLEELKNWLLANP